MHFNCVCVCILSFQEAILIAILDTRIKLKRGLEQ